MLLIMLRSCNIKRNKNGATVVEWTGENGAVAVPARENARALVYSQEFRAYLANTRAARSSKKFRKFAEAEQEAFNDDD